MIVSERNAAFAKGAQFLRGRRPLPTRKADVSTYAVCRSATTAYRYPYPVNPHQ